jgi:hypothetical protein
MAFCGNDIDRLLSFTSGDALALMGQAEMRNVTWATMENHFRCASLGIVAAGISACTAQHSTAQHSTAQHSTAQHTCFTSSRTLRHACMRHSLPISESLIYQAGTCVCWHHPRLPHLLGISPSASDYKLVLQVLGRTTFDRDGELSSNPFTPALFSKLKLRFAQDHGKAAVKPSRAKHCEAASPQDWVCMLAALLRNVVIKVRLAAPHVHERSAVMQPACVRHDALCCMPNMCACPGMLILTDDGRRSGKQEQHRHWHQDGAIRFTPHVLWRALQ